MNAHPERPERFFVAEHLPALGVNTVRRQGNR